MGSEQAVEVRSEDGQWQVRHGDDVSGPYSTEKQAVAAAIQQARRLFAGGVEAAVVVTASDGSSRTEWTPRHDTVRKDVDRPAASQG